MSAGRLAHCALLLGLLTPAAVTAHPLDVTTARLVLRDGHAQVIADADVLQLLAHTSPAEPDATAIATAAPEALEAQVAAVRSTLAAGARVEADGVAAPLELRAFPSAVEIRAAAAQASAAPGAPPAFLPIRYEAARPIHGARTLSVTLPAVLGPVLFTLLQPTTRLAAPGAAAAFAVLEPRAAPGRGAWLAGLAGLAGLLTLCLSRPRGRRVLSALALALGLGCSDPASGVDAGAPSDAAPALDAAAAALALTSSAFVDGGALPVDFTCDGVGASPPLSWSGAPGGTAEFTLLMTTLARDGLKWNWVLYHIPPTATALDRNSRGVGTAGLTSDGPNLAYSPPCSQGPGAKTYTFTLYALSAVPTYSQAPNQVTGPVVTDAIANITLAKRQLNVSYTR